MRIAAIVNIHFFILSPLNKFDPSQYCSGSNCIAIHSVNQDPIKNNADLCTSKAKIENIM